MKIPFLVIGIIAWILIPLVIYLYIRKIKRENSADFKIKEKKFSYEIFYFWSHIVYLFFIFTLIIIALVFIPVGIGSI